MSGCVSVLREDEVWTLTLARPEKRNALSAELVEELLALVQSGPEEGAKVLVFRGEGKNFSAGFDLSDIDRHSEADLVLRFIRVELLLQAVRSSPCLTVALVHGRTFGAGVDLVGVCRHRVASPDATFRMPGLKFGLVLGTRRFGEIVGLENAAAVLETAATFGAEGALAMRFLHETAQLAEWPAVVERARSRAAALPAFSRKALYAALNTTQPDADLAALVRSAARPGLKERIMQYLADS
jgi:enoyl-CoA hydratase